MSLHKLVHDNQYKICGASPANKPLPEVFVREMMAEWVSKIKEEWPKMAVNLYPDEEILEHNKRKLYMAMKRMKNSFRSAIVKQLVRAFIGETFIKVFYCPRIF